MLAKLNLKLVQFYLSAYTSKIIGRKSVAPGSTPSVSTQGICFYAGQSYFVEVMPNR